VEIENYPLPLYKEIVLKKRRKLKFIG